MAMSLPHDALAQIDGPTTGEVVDNVTAASSNFPHLTSLFAYLTGLILAVSGLYKFKEHVDNPSGQTHLSDAVKRLGAGGMFLSLPFMANAVRGNLMGATAVNSNMDGAPLPTAANAGGVGGGAGALDTLAVNFITDLAGPMEGLLSAFTYIAAGILLVVGIGRLTKRAEEGPKGPGGFGTIMTFIVSGALFASGDMVGAFTNSMFGDSALAVAPQIDDDIGLGDTTRAETVIQAVMIFIIVVGLIAFIRGWLVLRAFADGQQGATLMQGLTFLIGGALAINLGELVNALQLTLGIEGISFS